MFYMALKPLLYGRIPTPDYYAVITRRHYSYYEVNSCRHRVTTRVGTRGQTFFLCPLSVRSDYPTKSNIRISSSPLPHS